MRAELAQKKLSLVLERIEKRKAGRKLCQTSYPTPSSSSSSSPSSVASMSPEVRSSLHSLPIESQSSLSLPLLSFDEKSMPDSPPMGSALGSDDSCSDSSSSSSNGSNSCSIHCRDDVPEMIVASPSPQESSLTSSCIAEINFDQLLREEMLRQGQYT